MIKSDQSMTAASQSLIAEIGLPLLSFDSRLPDSENSLRPNSDRLGDVV
jgi:hypothetical protein